MVNEFTYLIADFLAEGTVQGYKKGIKKIIALNEKTVTKFSLSFSKKKPSWLSADYTTEDEAALKNFVKECFEVAGVGSYELQEKLKALAVEVWKNKEQNFDLFEQEARKIMLQYIPIPDQPPSGWLETNFNTALNSAYSAAEYNRLQDEDVKALYPAYQYKTRNDDRVRPEHEELHDMIFYNNDPFLDYGWPPNDWNCRCFMLPLDEDETKAADVTPMIRDEETNKQLLSNVAADFRRNPAQDKSIFGKWLNTKYNDLPKNIVSEIKSLSKTYSKEFDLK